MSESATTATTPGQLLERIGGELGHQADAVRSLHDLAVEADTPRAVRLAQTIDRTSQILDELGMLLTRLASTAGAPMDDPTPFAELVRLSELRRVLFAPTSEAEADGDGDLELF